MRADFHELDIPNTDATDGEEQNVSLLRDKWVAVFGTFVADFDILVSFNNGADYIELHSNVTAEGVYEIKPMCTHVLIHVNTYGSGNPQAIVSGLNTRTD